jgi:outer membrane immunogenic protein
MSRRLGWSIALALCVASIGNAAAQDVKVVPWDWTGFYAGVNAGYSWSQNSKLSVVTANQFGEPALVGGVATSVASAALGTTGSAAMLTDGFAGGGQIGFSYQLSEAFVAGFEADFQAIAAGDNRKTVLSSGPVAGFPASPVFQSLTFSSKLDYIGTIRGRIGYAVSPQVLVYGTAGLAYGQATSNTTLTQTVQGNPAVPFPYTSFGTVSSVLYGWTGGGGIEWRFASRWSAKAEYLYYDLGTLTYAMTPLQNANLGSALYTRGAPTASAIFNGNIIRAGVNFHF